MNFANSSGNSGADVNSTTHCRMVAPLYVACAFGWVSVRMSPDGLDQRLFPLEYLTEAIPSSTVLKVK